MKTRMRRATTGFATGSILVVGLTFLLGSCLMDDSPAYPDFYEQLESDLAAIDAYLATNNITAERDPDSVIRYVIHRDSTDTPQPTITDCATVNYAGFLLGNGSKFDEGKNFSFPINGVIDGWKIAIPLLNRGDSATIYIPSGLAYGFYGSGSIPSNANLTFRVGIVDVGETYSSSGGGSCN